MNPIALLVVTLCLITLFLGVIGFSSLVAWENQIVRHSKTFKEIFIETSKVFGSILGFIFIVGCWALAFIWGVNNL